MTVVTKMILQTLTNFYRGHGQGERARLMLSIKR